MLEAAVRWRFRIQGYRSQVFLYLIITDVFRQPPEVQAEDGYTTDVILQGAFALILQDYLLLKGFVDFLKGIDTKNGFFNNRWF